MDVFDNALKFAIEKHSGQTRKLTHIPYILHPIEVASIVGTMTGDKEVLAAAVLHDTIEDAGATAGELETLFGKRVCSLVLTETEDKRTDRPPQDTWKIRKEETLSYLKNSDDIGVKMLWLGDKLSNLRSLSELYKVQGDEVWKSFHQNDPAIQAWYYLSVAENLSELKEYSAYREFVSLINVVFSDYIFKQ